MALNARHVDHDELVDLHLAQILKLETGATKTLLAIYRENLDALIDELELTPEATFRAEYLRQIIAQMTAGIRAIEGKLYGPLFEHVRQAQALGIQHAKEEVILGELTALDRPVPLARLEASYAAVINAPALVAVRDTLELSTNTWANGEIGVIKNTLIEGILQSKTSKQVAADLRRALGPKVEDYKIMRIAETEVWKAANLAHRESIDAISAEFPELDYRHKWNAILDGATCGYCRGLDQKLVVTGADGAFEFEITGGKRDGMTVRVKAPPAHPKCRCYLETTSDRWNRRNEITKEDVAAALELLRRQNGR